MNRDLLPRPLAEGANFPVLLDDPRLDTPAILADLDIVDANIERMARFAARERFKLRPHIKTHKSLAMAKRQMSAGAAGICTATVSEAEEMARGGIDDILIAYPLIGVSKFRRLAAVFDLAKITLAADSVAVIETYAEFAESIGRKIPVLLEIDTGMHRVGVAPECAPQLVRLISQKPTLDFAGIMTHAGQTHDFTSLMDITAVARSEARIMGQVREDIERASIEVRSVSAGSSITAPYLRQTDGITEIRPGTYIYNDLRTLGLFACTPDNLAVTALATIVSLDADRITLHAGSKTLTSTKDSVFGHGLLRDDSTAWFTRLSEEHGVLHSKDAAQNFKVGQRVQINPVHVCVWMDLQPEIYGTRQGQIIERITVDAMRHSL
jgi:D-serine deaminase-like pyridoxal phosphate-dependent protein